MTDLYAPDWYAEWRHEAIHELMAKQDRLKEAYDLWRLPRYDYDVDAGTLVFSNEGVALVVADIQVVGTVGKSDWLWSWANNHWPDSATIDLMRVRQFGIDSEIDELTTEYLESDDLNALGWEMTAVAARILESKGAYRTSPDEDGGAVFFVLRSVRVAN